MKTAKLLLGIGMMLGLTGLNEAMGQWGVNGTHIYNTNTGNVGIGTSAPGKLLDVNKNMTEPTIRVFNNGGAGGSTFQMSDLTSGADWKFKATNTGGFKIRDNAFGLDVIVVDANSDANALYIDPNGFVGFGTSTPTQRLHIVGNMESNVSYPFWYLNNTNATGNAGINFEYNSSDRAWIFFDGSDNVLRLNASTSNGYRNDLVITPAGNVCIGTNSPATGYSLSVNGKVACEEVLVEADANWPDYVFTDSYDLMSLSDLEKSIEQNNHLPGLPSAAEVGENGFELADMQKRVVRKVEELTLYAIEQGKQIEALQQKVAELEQENQKLRKNR